MKAKKTGFIGNLEKNHFILIFIANCPEDSDDGVHPGQRPGNFDLNPGKKSWQKDFWSRYITIATGSRKDGSPGTLKTAGGARLVMFSHDPIIPGHDRREIEIYS